MKNKCLVMLLAVVTIGLNACTKKLEKVLPGTWNIAEYHYTDGTFSQTITDYGKITFNDNGTGLFAVEQGGSSFTDDFVWTSDGKETVTIDGETYTVTVNKPKKQVFELRDGDAVATMTLEK